MKVGAAWSELNTRSSLASDADAERDERQRAPEFEQALAKLRHAAPHADCDSQDSDAMSSQARGGLDRRTKRHDTRGFRDHNELLSEDQLLCATGTNPVLAALAATRWQWPSKAAEVTRADGLALSLNAGSVQESLLSRAGHAYVGSHDHVDGAAPSNVRQSDDRLTETLGRAALQPHTDAVAERGFDDGLRVLQGVDAQPTHAESQAQISAISAENIVNCPPVASAIVAPNEVAPSANVPSLPAATAQRLIDGTLAALRIDRDTANPQHSTSYLEVRHPELGVVKAEVRMHGDAMEVRFEATTLAAAALLRASESVLRKSLGHHGLRLRNLQIDARGHLMQERARRARRHLLDLEA